MAAQNPQPSEGYQELPVDVGGLEPTAVIEDVSEIAIAEESKDTSASHPGLAGGEDTPRELSKSTEELEEVSSRETTPRATAGKEDTDGGRHGKAVLNGLQLCLKGNKHAFVSYNYALTPFMDVPLRMDWKILTAEGVECQHIRYHELQKGDSISSLVTKYRKAHAVALVLVNTDSTLILPFEFQEKISRPKRITFPVILTAADDGKSMREFLRHHDPGEIHAKISAKNLPQVDFSARQQLPADGSYSPSVISRASAHHKQGGFRRSLRYKGSRRLAINLKEEIKQLMFPLSGPVCVSEDYGLFQVVMSTFYQYEQMMVREGRHTNDGGVFRRLTKHMEEMFARDSPFYLLIAYRVHKRQHLYQCDELSPFIQSCIERFEKLDQGTIARTLEAFLKTDNFKIMFDANDATLTVFHLLEMASIEMMKLSAATKGQEGSHPAHRQVYFRMMWISIASKCHVERGSRDPTCYWTEHLIKNVRLPFLDTETIQNVKKGVEFGRMLQLPDEVAFTSSHMADLLVPEGTARPFFQMRDCIQVLEPYVQLEKDFLRDFLQHPRTSYTECYHQGGEEGLKAVYPEGNLLVILQEGILFLDKVLEVCRKRHWLSGDMDEEMKKWLSLLLQMVDVTSERAESCLKDLILTTRSGGVTKEYREHIKRELICKVEDSFGQLSVEQFLRLYKAFLIWPTWVVESYLRQYKIPKEVRICSPTWTELIAEFVERFTDAHHHEFLLEFMKSVAKCYLEQGRAKDFVLDLLQLDVPSLFVTERVGSTSTLQSDNTADSVPEDFTSFLADYIQRNSLQDAMLREVETIWKCITEQSEFQQLVLLVLQQELIPESLALHGTLSKPLNFLLNECVTTVCGELKSFQELSSRLTFCWGIISSSCNKMIIANGFDWITSYSSLISQLGRIYGTFCSQRGLVEKTCILKPDSLPAELEDCPSSDVKNFFSWVARAQQLLASWKKKFEGKRINFDDILTYIKHFSQINRLASSLSAGNQVVEIHYVQAVKQEFLQSFEILNIFLLHYVTGNPDSGWCGLQHLLAKYGVGLPSNLLHAFSQYIILPGESSAVKQAVRLETDPSASISKSFAPPNLDISLVITRELDLYTLKQTVHELDMFLNPIREHLLQLLVYFTLSDSKLFDKYLKLQLSGFAPKQKSLEELVTPMFTLPALVFSGSAEYGMPRGLSVDLLAAALKQTDRLLMKILQGTASYADIVADGAVDLQSVDIDREFETLNQYAKIVSIDTSDAEGLKGVKAMLQLCQLTHHIQTIYGVCAQYQLDECLNDPELQELVELVGMLEKRENQTQLTAKDAIEKMDKVSLSLFLEGKQTPKYLDLFAAVADSAVFHHFVTEKQFVGESGQALFRQQYQLITTQLQHEEYNEVVLNHLFAAFRFITPFMDKEQNFKTLMLHVSSLNAYDARKQLNTVNRNINLIRLWFSRAEGDTLRGVARELDCVLNTGHYEFVFTSAAERTKGTLELIYRPVVVAYVEEGGAAEVVTQRWNKEQINDFVRKLGFLDSEGAAGDKINHFLHLHQTANKLLDLYSRLRELGHPSYLQRILNQVLSCTLSQEEADEKVQRASQSLTSWEKEVVKLRAQYEQLLYFTIPKLLHVYHMITATEHNVDGVVQAVSFLFQNKPHVMGKLKEAIQGILNGTSNSPDFRSAPGNTPMHVVGSFLATLFSNHDLSGYSLRARRMSTSLARSVSSQSTHILHSCQGFTQAQLLRLIVTIYGGVPEAFEVFHCRLTTTEEELRLFLDPKRATKQPFQFLILEVNRLPYQLQEALIRLHFDLKQQHSDIVEAPCVHFIEMAPSLLQEMPWILHRDYKGADPSLDFAQAMMTCKRYALIPDDFSCVQLVYGNAGDGKTHYIESQLRHCPTYLRIVVNETFTPLTTIQKLLTLPTGKQGCAVFFNFTLLPPGESVDEVELNSYKELIDTIGWFFFDLFVLGYVEDPLTGVSFRFPGGMSWAVYIEVPSRNDMSSEESLEMFYEDVPALGLLGTPHVIHFECPFEVDTDVQLVCKYLNAFRVGGTKGIDRLFKEGGGIPIFGSKPGNPVKFSLEPDLSKKDCHKLLDMYTPQHMKKNKTTQKLFIRYMKRRCEFLDNCPAFNYNPGSTEYIVSEDGQHKKNDTRQLGSTLMDTMLREVSDFCDPIIRENWSLKPHHQLVYDFKDGGGTFGLMSLHPDLISLDDKDKFTRIGVEIPSMMDLHKREWLDRFLSRALDVPLDENQRLTAIDDSAYVLTLDFALKMLNIHERALCGVPLIIEGETGVGKTALIEMLSKLWNYSLVHNWTLKKGRLYEYMRIKLGELPPRILERFSGSSEALTALANGDPIREDDLILIGELPTEKGGKFFTVLRDEMLELAHDPVLCLVELGAVEQQSGLKFSKLFASAKFKNNVKDTAKLLHAFLNAKVKSTFYKLNIHAALRPSDIIAFFEPVFKQAKELSDAYEGMTSSGKVPFITVFLDEVNTSCSLGLFKEIIVDRTLDGKAIPSNIFIIGANNPHRGNSLAAFDTWVRGTYYVRQLHPTLQCLMWDYGALGEQQERDYIHAKMKMCNQHSSRTNLANLTDLIVKSQNLMREYSMEQLKSCGLQDYEAAPCSRSCVSQRDIQRVFTFYDWLMKMYGKFQPHGEDTDYSSRAVAVALGLVYYLRLDSQHREKYRKAMDHETSLARIKFSTAFEEELDWYMDHIDLPEGIARTQALKENLFANIVCTMTHTPLIIVGQPGSSKTLSFNLALANLKGEESKIAVFRDTEVFRSLDPHFYQCSRRTTSNEIQTVFSRAMNRQRDHSKVPLPVYCVVFMDEAGLPEERHESLKVLHYFLDRQEVSFVAISNHVLDAAKTNRAVSLYRPEATQEELVTLAKGCLCPNPDNPPQELKKDVETVAHFCPAYETIMSDPQLKDFFGLRDFIHFISYLRRKRLQMLSPQLVMEAVERNFNGVDSSKFQHICKLFLRAVRSTPESVSARNILDVLQSSLHDHPEDTGAENEMRYKLIIDPSEDGSLVRLLFSSGVLQRSSTRVYVCSDFPGDAELQKVNTIAAVRHSATEGHMVVMTQTDAIHESFYDLFNRRFHRIDASTGPRFYANIAIGAHIKPCRVHPDFECVVVVKQSEVQNIPAPFLNRFEKYCLSHELVLRAALSKLPPALKKVICSAQKKVDEFVERIGGSSSIYGLHKDTVNSLILTLLPPNEHEYCQRFNPPARRISSSMKANILGTLLQVLRQDAGFHVPSCSEEELRLDAEEVFALVLRDSEFAGHFSQITPNDILPAVNEALYMLYHTVPPHTTSKEVTVEVSTSACMVVSVLTQWLIRLLVKHLLQLITSEAVCMHHQKIPSSYIRNYLNYQHHFSLKALLESQHTLLKSNGSLCSTKLLCFTRSSQLVHQLPTQYPTAIHLSSETDDSSEQLLKDMVFSDPAQVAVHKLSSITTFSSVNELIRSFVASESLQVILLIVNMQETSKEVVNHLRIMIEEAESLGSSRSKVFAVLLHFPTSKLSSPCYPSIFLRGWDFHYLDVIGCGPTAGILDIRDWFKQCYAGRSTSSFSEDDSVTQQLHSLLHEAIPIAATKVYVGNTKSSSFNVPMSIPERKAALESLLSEKGVGEVLCERFLSYWQPSVMVEYLEKSATFAHEHETTLNLIDSLHLIFKNLFIDFVVYMVSQMNVDNNIDVIFSPDCSPCVKSLFLTLLRIHPVPKLSELKMLRILGDTSSLDDSKPPLDSPKFPFFEFISTTVEKLTEQSRREINEQVNMLSEHRGQLPLSSVFDSPPQARAQAMSDMVNVVQAKLEDTCKGPDHDCNVLAVAVNSMLEEDELWQRYLEDFTHRKLHLEFGSTGISHKILRAAFGTLEERSALECLAIVHVYIHIHKLNLARVVSVLRPLDRIEVAASLLPSLSERVHSPTRSLFQDVEHGEDFLGKPAALSVFIIDTLFSAIAGINISWGSEMSETALEHLRVWYNVYRDMMSMPTLMDHIYHSRSSLAEAQHNVMHTAFLVMRSSSDTDTPVELQQALSIFGHLFNKYFWTNLELRGAAGPRLGDIATEAVEALTGVKLTSTLSKDNPRVRHFLEGLLAHFFSEHMTSYNQDDVQWFLEIANQQTHWQSTYLISEVVEVEYSGDLLSHLDFTPESPKHSSASVSRLTALGCVPMSTFKFFLHKMLEKGIQKGSDPIHSIMLYFQQTDVHQQIADELCLKDSPENSPESDDEPTLGPYIPTFYQFCEPVKHCAAADITLMQQPLCHLYFLTVLENLTNSNFMLSSLVSTMSSITKQCDGGSVTESERILLLIEKQAVVQAIIRSVAQHLDLRKDSKINTLLSLLTELNTILDDESMGGGSIGGHGLVLAMHMLKELQSFRRFHMMLTDQYTLLLDGINCLKPIHAALSTNPSIYNKQEPSVMLYADMGQEFQILYQKVCTSISAVHSFHGTAPKVKDLTRLAAECSSGDIIITSPSGSTVAWKKASCFKMALWLATYNEFFSKKKHSPALAGVIKNNLSKYIDPSCVQLLCCFLCPEQMKRKRRSSDSQPPHMLDPIISLFVAQSTGPEDPLVADMRNALVHLIAVVLGSPPCSTHLWYHMFSPEELATTYITGFMCNSPVGPDTMFYDQGVELTEEGLYGQHAYLDHATRGTLSLHSLYLLLWVNFASFSIALLTQSDAEEKLVGSIFSDSHSIRQYCAYQVQKLWQHLRDGLAISDDERSLLVKNCLNQLFELQVKSPKAIPGKLSTAEQLDRYEEMWHSLIFTPQWNSLKFDFASTCRMIQNPVFEHIRHMDCRYPWFVTESTLTRAILSRVDVSNAATNELYPLSRFVLEYPRLKIGGDLLPSIVELYQWLHSELAYAVTYDDATTITLSRLAKVVARRMPGDRKAQYEKLKATFNEYVQLTGCTKNKRPVKIADDTPLLHLLSYNVDGEQGNDLLYCVITDLIAFHNQFLSQLLDVVKPSTCSRYCPEDVPKVHVMEFSRHYRMIKNIKNSPTSSLLQLIHARSHLPLAFTTDPTRVSGHPLTHSHLPGQMAAIINLHELQEDILQTYIAGKPHIDQSSIASLRIPFKFKEDVSSASLHMNLRDCVSDLNSIAEKLPQQLKVPLEDDYRKRVEYEFHSASYLNIMEVITGLRTAVAHLIRKTTTQFRPSEFDRELLTQTLPKFLITLYEYNPQDESRDIFHEIGIHSLTQTQHSCLEGLRLAFLFNTLKMFVGWAQEGWYDFSSLPFGVKMPMALPDEDTLRQIPSHYEGSPADLLKELRSFVEVLVHLEVSIVKTDSNNPQLSLMRYLKGLQICSDRDKVVSMIPDTILLEHYVSLRLALRRLITEVQKDAAASDLSSPMPDENKWDDFASDLWDTHLPYFRQRGFVYCSAPVSIFPPRAEGADTANSSELLKELIHYNSETNLLEALEEQPASPGPEAVHVSSPEATPVKQPSEKGHVRTTSIPLLLKRLSSHVEEDLQQKASRFSVKDVVNFLEENDLEHYTAAFEEYDINGELLIQFKEEELKELGVIRAVDRLKIRIFFKRLVVGSADFATRYSPSVVAQFLKQNKQLKQFATAFEDNGMDGELVLSASDEAFRELGVEKGVYMRMIRTRFRSYIA